MRFLVIRVGNMGDVLMVTPVIRTLKKAFPKCRVDVLTSPQAKCIVEHNKDIDEIFVYQKYRYLKGRLRKWLLLWTLRKRSYDHCLILELHPQYKILAQQACGAKTQKIGFTNRGEEHLDKKLLFSYDIHVMKNYFLLLQEFFNIEISEDDFQVDFNYPEIAEESTRGHRAQQKSFVIHPGCTEYWPYRGWSAKKFAQTISFLQDNDFNVILTGKGADQNIIHGIFQYCDEESRKNITVVMDKDIYERAAVVKQASGLLCSETGVLHFARAYQVPVLALFGPSNPEHTGAIGLGRFTHIRNDFPCGPCNYYSAYRTEDKANCIDGQIPPCMQSISIEQVKIGLTQILQIENVKI